MITPNELKKILEHRIINADTLEKFNDIKPEIEPYLKIVDVSELYEYQHKIVLENSEIKSGRLNIDLEQRRKAKEKRHEVFGEMITINEAVEKYGKKYNFTRIALRSRMYGKRKLSLQEAIEFQPGKE